MPETVVPGPQSGLDPRADPGLDLGTATRRPVCRNNSPRDWAHPVRLGPSRTGSPWGGLGPSVANLRRPMRRVCVTCVILVFLSAAGFSGARLLTGRLLPVRSARTQTAQHGPRKHHKHGHRRKATLGHAYKKSHPGGGTKPGRKPPGPGKRGKLDVLLGNRRVEPLVDVAHAGSAMAFPFRAASTGLATSIQLYIGAGSRATGVIAAVYSDQSSRPGSRITWGRRRLQKARGWNAIAVRSAALRAGRMYWLVVLPRGGKLPLRDRAGGRCHSEMSRRSNLAAMPLRWGRARRRERCRISAAVMGHALRAGIFSGPIGGLTPSDVTAPQVDGATLVGNTVAASAGSWSGSPTSFDYQWELCDAGGRACSAIPGATGGTYTISPTDLNATLAVVVTAVNGAGSATASSLPSGMVGPPGVRIFYISYAGGSDSNSGTSTTSAWQHAPGMNGCVAACSSYRGLPGDRFIFEGGDIWPNRAFPFSTGSGSGGAPDYYGVETDWYVGPAFARPTFDAGNALTPGADANGPGSFTGPGQNDVMMDLYRRDYVQVDDIHFTGFRRDSTMTSVQGVCAVLNSSNQGNPAYDQNITYNRLLIDHMYDDAADVGCDAIVGGNSEAGHYAGNSVVENSTIAGDGATYMKGIGLIGNIENNVIHDLPGLIGPVTTGTATISGNVLYNCMYPALPSDGGQANNQHADELIIGGVTTSSTPAATYYIHDNVFARNGQSGYSSGSGTGDECESLMIGNWNETDYVYNNVFYNLYGNGPVSPQSGAPTIAGAYYWNNSIEPGTGAAGGEQCFRFEGGSTTYQQLSIQNNLCVTTSGAVYGNTGAHVLSSAIDHNVVVTPSQLKPGGAYAGDFGLPGTTSFVWQPLGNAPTNGSGTNLSSKCPGALAALCSDTTYGGARASLARPGGTTAWDVGAYQVP